MAIPIGSTERQLGGIVRWMLVCVVAMSVLLFWWPGQGTWGAVVIGLFACWALWLLWRLAARDNRIPGHPLAIVLAGPVAILVAHYIPASITSHPSGAAGLLDASMVLQLLTMALAAELTLSVLARSRSAGLILAVCGGAMMLGPAAALAWGRAVELRHPLSLLVGAGVCVWLSALWARMPGHHELLPATLRRELRVAAVTVGAAAVGLLGLLATRDLAAALVTAGVVGLLAGIVFRAGRWAYLSIAGACVLLGALAAAPGGSPAMALSIGEVGLFGVGEQAIWAVPTSQAGLGVLHAWIGWAGVGWLLLASAGAMVWILAGARRYPPGVQRRAALGCLAAGLSLLALLAPGGPVSPAVTVAAGFCWGVAAAATPRRRARIHGAVLLVPLGLYLGMIALGRGSGLLMWILQAHGASEDWRHVLGGFFVTLTLAWSLGCRRWWMGLVGVALGVGVGAAGEMAQRLTPWRGVELSDFVAHCLGSAAAMTLFLLVVGSRLCEKDMPPPTEDAYSS